MSDSGGGGGYGPPTSARSRASPTMSAKAGRAERAEAVYGVAIDADGIVDEAATRDLRGEGTGRPAA